MGIGFLPSVDGPVFLMVYLPVLMAVLIWHALATRRASDDRMRPLPPLNPFQAAVYAGDRATIAMSVASELVSQGLIDPFGRVRAPGATKLSPAARMMLDQAYRHGQIPDPGRFVKDRQVADLIRQTREYLRITGHYVRSPARGAGLVARVVVGLLFVIGALRLVGGLLNGRPSMFLLLALLMTLFIVAATLQVRWRRSKAGMAQVRDLAWQLRSQPPAGQLHPLAVPLFGAAALLSVAPVAQNWLGRYSPADLQSAGLAAAASGPYSGWAVTHGVQPTSSCSTTSCSSSGSCGSSGGDGGGGGGCGGCGGGGD